MILHRALLSKNPGRAFAERPEQNYSSKKVLREYSIYQRPIRTLIADHLGFGIILAVQYKPHP